MKQKFIHRFSSVSAIVLVGGLLLFVAGGAARAQSVPTSPSTISNDGSTIFGNFKVSGIPADVKAPETFYIVLYFTTGLVHSRTTVGNPGRYRLLNVPNGVYDLVVEAENQELVRIRRTVQELTKTEIPFDLEFEWGGAMANRAAAAGVAAYNRSAANQAKYDKALAEARNKNNDGASELFKQIVAEDAKDFVAWTELGTVQFKQERLGDAEKSYRQALTVKPDYIVALMNLGKVQLGQKNFDGAIETFTKAVAVEPKSAEANHFLGEAYLQVKKGSKAVGYLNEAIKLDPLGKADVHLRLATLYNGAGLKDRAAAEYEAFLSKKPDHPEKKKFEEYIKANKKQ